MANVEYFLLLHFGLALTAGVITAKTNKSQALCIFFLVLLIPVFGMLLWGASLFFGCRRLPAVGDLSALFELPVASRFLLRGPEDHEKEVVPVQDALLLADTDAKRALMGRVIRYNILRNPELLFQAVRDQDSEVSHYAVSAVSSQIEDLEGKLYKLEQELAGAGQTGEMNLQYADLLSSYLKIGFLDAVSQKLWEQKYLRTLDSLIRQGAAEKKHYSEMINYHLAHASFSKADAACREFRKIYPGDEEPYLMQMKLYYLQKDLPRLRQTIDSLKASYIGFSQKTLNYVRFWEGGQEDAS